MSRRDAATYLGKRPGTLAFWAAMGTGPKQIKIGGRSYYSVDELERWIASGGDSAPAPASGVAA